MTTEQRIFEGIEPWWRGDSWQEARHLKARDDALAAAVETKGPENECADQKSPARDHLSGGPGGQAQ